MSLDIEKLRADTPGCNERIHLNNAGAALMPVPVLNTIQEHLELESHIGGYEACIARLDAIQESYQSVAGLLGTHARNIAFVENATVAFSQALSAIPFEPGDVILTSQDDYVSNQIMFLSMAKRLGVKIVHAPVSESGGVDVSGMVALMDQLQPRLVTLTHIPTNSGLVQPVGPIGQACRERNILYLVDACQSVGQRPLDVNAIDCDFLCGTSRKFLRGPRGAGFLYVSDRVLEAGLEPLFIDMRGADWTDVGHYQPVNSAQRFENWEFAYALVLGTGAAARYASELGLDAIEQRVCSLAEILRDGLRDLGLQPLDRGNHPAAIVTVNIPGVDPSELMTHLAANNINGSMSPRHYAVMDYDQKEVPWALRLSPHYYNTSEEIKATQEALESIIS